MTRTKPRDELTEILSGFSLFSDLTRAQLEAASQAFEEMWFSPNQRVIRQGFAQPDFHLIIEGEAVIRVDGQERAHLTRGDFFGEISVLLGEDPAADVVASTKLRCLVLTSKELTNLLSTYPPVMYRMLQTEARRLRNAIEWRA
jgi:CRP/FNR family cyclic AMP-dependent transcriptional regulator